MSLISVKNLTFGYESSYKNIFENLLTSLFLKGNNFLLIDEPTNHLDSETKENLAKYLQKKKGFILVSHDRDLMQKRQKAFQNKQLSIFGTNH